ncbi:hypothetical protein CHGG_03479 [Chaetomium globosum CBS 148.51]|uniref:Myb-like domain-containing protein n=1 Tax=Chaetomium globosum (strain ATCC 6205 / CBS 148.51 / DSM 1962 / NBRC 6347 / NRRL 1970) TaxID=306901 RepID=Q2H8H5_CHAGB|nr:uncharacterized protein CHGG_03479 [Chaetomium globosum CBS 148.51]EAQ91544.1 hypothetical protein CHGG_03479 [Chaetomium globosum CBS 148.51]
MSFNQLSPKPGWAQPGPRQAIPQHGLPTYESGYFAETQDTGESMSLMVRCLHLHTFLCLRGEQHRGRETNVWFAGKAGAGYSLTGNRTSRSAFSSFSHYPTSTELRGVSLFSDANVPASDPLDSSYWQMVPHGVSALSPFAQGGDPIWDHSLPGISSNLEYSQYTWDVHTSAFPQTPFRPGDALQHLSLPPMFESDLSTNSKLYASSGRLENMALDDPEHPIWDASPGVRAVYEEAPYTKTEPGQSDDDKTVSPKLLRIRQTPTPSSSCESLHTSFLSDAHLHEPPNAMEALPSVEVPLPSTAPKLRKQLPNAPTHSLRSLPYVNNTHRRASPTDSDFSSTASVNFDRRPHPRARHAESESSSSSSLSSSPVPIRPPKPLPSHLRRPPRAWEPVKLTDRKSKDEFLVKHKQQGMTYKEIRRLGGFIEAESTLRGRYRTLTKSREERVRKPEWSEKDVSVGPCWESLFP